MLPNPQAGHLTQILPTDSSVVCCGGTRPTWSEILCRVCDGGAAKWPATALSFPGRSFWGSDAPLRMR